MKQGRASVTNTVGTKREPIARAVSETFAGQIGQHFGTQRAIRSMYEGRIDNKAPPSKNIINPHGSQGRHK
jgi:hypothetical protein